MSLNEKRRDAARLFAKRLNGEVLGDVNKRSILFGTVQHRTDRPDSDTDVAVVVDIDIERLDKRSEEHRINKCVQELARDIEKSSNPGVKIHVTLCSENLYRDQNFNGDVLEAIRRGEELHSG
jgi:predicted nucleotidyltransferase